MNNQQKNNLEIECVVVGAGVVGLALARQLSMQGKEVVIIEATDKIGTGISSRNSEVIHAGIYYPPGSLKARFCVAGNKLLYDYCNEHGVEYRRCGKLIVATNENQFNSLQQIEQKAIACGAVKLEMLTTSEVRKLEPGLNCVAALYSPSTGIIDSHGLMKSLLHEAQSYGAALALISPLLSGQSLPGGLELKIGGAEPSTIIARRVYNCAGLAAHLVIKNIKGIKLASMPTIYYAKGNYFSLACRAPFSRLIYPVPQAAGLGVHLTFDLGGQARFGPDVEWVNEIEYSVNPERANSFYAEIRRYWPKLADNALEPAYCGIRPKLQGPDDSVKDFYIQQHDVHGVKGLVNLLGIESPGLTSCLELAKFVASLDVV